MLTLLVTGGAGFIGGNFVHHIIETTDARVVNLDILTYAGNLDTLADLKENPRHVFVQGDIADPALVARLLAEYEVDAVVNFAAGGVATPADAALMMRLGVDGVFVGSGIFKSGDPAKRAAAIVKAVTHYKDASILAEVSKNLGEAMVGRNVSQMPEEEKIAGRGW